MTLVCKHGIKPLKNCSGCLNEKRREYRKRYEIKTQRKHSPAYHQANKKFQRKFHLKNPNRYDFYNEAHRYPILNQCEFCNSIEGLERHHPDYNYPEIFVTTCNECHSWIERESD